MEEEYKKFVDFYKENIPIGKGALPLEDIAPFMRATGSLFQRALFNWHYHWASTDIYDRLAADEVSYVNTFLKLLFLRVVRVVVQVINEVKPLYTKHLRLRVSICRYSDMAYIIGCARALRMQPQFLGGWTT